jgi:MYXO-CTERM domain-containing protein
VNKSTDPTALPGLSNLDLVVQGGPGWVVPVEVAGKDLGAVAPGWTNNFALAALTLGDTQAGKVRLVNDFANQPGWAGAEALYVDSLVLNPGAAVDLNGLNLYYRNGGAAKRFFVGDAFLDGDVDFADYQVLETHFGTTSGAVWSDGDFNGDGTVDFADYQLLEANFGQQTPEPGCAALLLLGGIGTLRRRRLR